MKLTFIFTLACIVNTFAQLSPQRLRLLTASEIYQSKVRIARRPKHLFSLKLKSMC